MEVAVLYRKSDGPSNPWRLLTAPFRFCRPGSARHPEFTTRHPGTLAQLDPKTRLLKVAYHHE
jgi:hypothetical protein